MANAKITDLANATALTGAELVETVQGGVNKKTTTQDIADLAVSSGHVIEDEGTPLTARTKLNFVGAPVTVTDDSGDDATVVTISNDDKADAAITYTTKTTSHTLDSADNTNASNGGGLMMMMDVASANDLIIPTNATQPQPIGVPIGVRQVGAGQTTVAPAVGVTLNGPNNAFKLAAQGALAVIEQTATDVWYINGETVI